MIDLKNRKQVIAKLIVARNEIEDTFRLSVPAARYDPGQFAGRLGLRKGIYELVPDQPATTAGEDRRTVWSNMPTGYYWRKDI